MSKANFKSIISSLYSTGIPSCHLYSSFSNFENKYDEKFYEVLYKITNQILAMDLSSSSKFLFLCGNTGSGKTHFMVSLYRAMIHKLQYSQGDGALFTTFAGLAQEVISLFSQNIPLRTSLAEYLRARWLFIDDFTSSERVLKENSLEFNMLRDILLDRHEKGRMLITSTNIDSVDLMAEIDRLFGSYVTSRLANSTVVQFPKIDLRKVRKEV